MHIRAPLFLASLLLAPAALAASTTDLSVKGLITPNACEPFITNGGVIEHGKLSIQSLAGEHFTALAPQTLQVRVQCDGQTLFALSTIDNRPGTSALDDNLHGLGMVNGNEKLGSVAFALSNPTSDIGPVRTIISTDGGLTWEPDWYLGHAALTAIAALDGTTPIAVKTFDANLGFHTSIAPANNLTLTDEIPLDGQATLQVKYL